MDFRLGPLNSYKIIVDLNFLIHLTFSQEASNLYKNAFEFGPTSQTGVTKPTIYFILSMGWCI